MSRSISKEPPFLLGAQARRPAPQQRLRRTATRAALQSDSESALQLWHRALAGAAVSLLGAAAAAGQLPACAAPLDGATFAAAASGTVPLRRAVVEDMLAQRLTDRLHTLSDSQLAELLEQLLKEDARFPAELLQPQYTVPPQPAPQPFAPWQRPSPEPAAQQPAPQPLMPTWQSPLQAQDPVQAPQQAPPLPQPQPQPQQPGRPSEQSQPQQQLGGVSGPAAVGSSEDQDATEQLLQQYQKQLAERSGGISAAGDRSAGVGWLPAALTNNWRLVVLAVVVPAVLIAVAGQLLGGRKQQSSEQTAAKPEQREQQLQQAQQQQEQQAQQGQKQRSFSLLSLIFGGDNEAEQQPGVAPEVAAGSPPAADATAAASQAQASPQPPAAPQQAAAAAPPPPPVPQYEAAADVPAAPGTILWERKEPSASSNRGSSSTAEGAILWRRKEPVASESSSGGEGAVLWRRKEPAAEADLPLPQQPAAASVPAVQPASSSEAVDLWRLPLEQLRRGSNGGGGTTANGANGAPVVAADGAAEARSPAPAPVAAPVMPARRPRDSALDNAEPDGWLGALQRPGRRRAVGGGSSDDDE